jgi:chloramphenicol-sensitive protein RarD
MGTGIVTAVPLLLFAEGAKHLTLSLIGFMQYIAPTIALALGVFLYYEPFTSIHQASFAFIWIALVIFSLAKTKWFMQWEQALRKTTLKSKETT